MVAHVVLFTPKPGLDAGARQRLAESFQRALREIPTIRRAHIGRRVTHGRLYEQLMTVDYQYAAILEFDSLADLTAYLEHETHDALGMSTGQLDANTGQTLWLSEARIAENAAVVRSGDLWFALNTEAKLLVARANPKQFEILKTYEVADTATWAQPVLSGQRVFIKDLSTISLWTLN